MNLSVIDLFCGSGALTHGFILEGFNVIAGFDADASCRHAYESNNRGAEFISKRIEESASDCREVEGLYPSQSIKVLVGCPPCQPFSSNSSLKGTDHPKSDMLSYFAKVATTVMPDVVVMENVPRVTCFQVYRDFIHTLKSFGYAVKTYQVYCPDYGIAQSRKRLIVFAARHEIDMLGPTCLPEQYMTVRQAIADLEPIGHGEVSESDRYHRATTLSELNLKRIKVSRQGGTWKDWPEELVLDCHKRLKGNSYSNPYGRMEWDGLAPTITTRCIGYGNGRFGHPEQDRGISLREAARFQTFPDDYEFVHQDEPIRHHSVARLIGNAVPVELARVIARSIKQYLGYEVVHKTVGQLQLF